MEGPEKKSVYHGSPREFGTVKPRENIRMRIEKGEEIVTFKDISFHATPHRWIALAYTYNASESFNLEGKQIRYNMGVDLYDNNKSISIYGFGSLEESLEKLYGEGGYLYQYDADHFFYTEGLGDLEVITQKEIDPIHAESIKNPVEELKKEGVTFDFIDLALPENEELREYVD